MSISCEDANYINRKWREGAIDKSTGLDAYGILVEWRKIVSERDDEPWETTKAKMFAAACDRVAIGVSPHDWFHGYRTANLDRQFSSIV